MSEGTEGTAVVTTDQIYVQLQEMGRTLLELKIRFEMVDDLRKRVIKVEERLDEDQRSRWQLPVAWTSAAAGLFGTAWQTWHK